jgi:hypothetical protein
VRPLLDEAGLVHHQDRFGIAQVLGDVGAQIVTHGVRVPVGAVEQMLHRVGRRVPHRLSQLPPILAFKGAEQPPQIDLGPLAGFRPGEARSDADRYHRHFTRCLAQRGHQPVFQRTFLHMPRHALYLLLGTTTCGHGDTLLLVRTSTHSVSHPTTQLQL